jgi:regulation of enolase protein 1 (concanavalin A-like superfamily)
MSVGYALFAVDHRSEAPMSEKMSRRLFVTASTLAGTALILPQTSAGASSPSEEKESWFNEPRQWRREGSVLICTANPKTDFWRKTYYPYITDNGHFLSRKVKGDFTSTIKVSGKYHDQYDQAGLMVRYDESNWMKCGVEFFEGRPNMSVVFTRDYSDWSTAPLPAGVGPLWVRINRKGSAFNVFYALDGKTFTLARSGYLTPAEVVELGPMLAAPEGKGFEARFEDFVIEPA